MVTHDVINTVLLYVTFLRASEKNLTNSLLVFSADQLKLE